MDDLTRKPNLVAAEMMSAALDRLTTAIVAATPINPHVTYVMNGQKMIFSSMATLREFLRNSDLPFDARSVLA